MPELPEVQTVVSGLVRLRGRRVVAVWTSGKALRLGRAVDAAGLRAALVGAPLGTPRRRGKYIVVTSEAGPGWLVHLGMSGRLRWAPAAEARAPHTHVVATLDDGTELRFVDPRRFGCVLPGWPPEALPELAQLGAEPLTMTAAALARALAASRAPIKTALLDQRRVVGVGNIYACEALHLARVHPRTEARHVASRARELLAAVKRVLRQAIRHRGTTLRDYRDADGAEGGNLLKLRVYGRERQPCPVCRTPVRRIVQSARSTFYCPRCQRG